VCGSYAAERTGAAGTPAWHPAGMFRRGAYNSSNAAGGADPQAADPNRQAVHGGGSAQVCRRVQSVVEIA